MNKNTTAKFDSYSDFKRILESHEVWDRHSELAASFAKSFATQAEYREECRKRKEAFGDASLHMIVQEDTPLVLDEEAVFFAAAALTKWNECAGACGHVALISNESINERNFPIVPCPWNLVTDFNDSMFDWASKHGIETPIRDDSGNVIHFVYGVEALDDDLPPSFPLYAPQVA